MRAWSVVVLGAAMVVAGCDRGGDASGSETAAETPTEAEGEGGEELFGEALSNAAVTPLDDITASPEQFAGQTVKTEGHIERVCQKRGCWMELRSEKGAVVHVPMAGHSFFLPKDSAGRQCTVEGKVVIEEMAEDEREHLRSEGAQALAQAMQLEATGVRFR